MRRCFSASEAQGRRASVRELWPCDDEPGRRASRQARRGRTSDLLRGPAGCAPIAERQRTDGTPRPEGTPRSTIADSPSEGPEPRPGETARSATIEPTARWTRLDQEPGTVASGGQTPPGFRPAGRPGGPERLRSQRNVPTLFHPVSSKALRTARRGSEIGLSRGNTSTRGRIRTCDLWLRSGFGGGGERWRGVEKRPHRTTFSVASVGADHSRLPADVPTWFPRRRGTPAARLSRPPGRAATTPSSSLRQLPEVHAQPLHDE